MANTFSEAVKEAGKYSSNVTISVFGVTRHGRYTLEGQFRSGSNNLGNAIRDARLCFEEACIDGHYAGCDVRVNGISVKPN